MTDTHPQGKTPEPPNQSTASPDTPTGLGRLARRMAIWTTNGLVTAIILATGLAFGRQVVRWWRPEADSNQPPAQAQPISDTLGDPTAGHMLRFGDQGWAVRRSEATGPAAEAAGCLRTMCREDLAAATAPQTAVTDAERRFLAGLAQRTPTDQQAGQWRLYQWNDTVPMVAGVLGDATPKCGAGCQPAIKEGRSATCPTGANLAESGLRVVIWGIAVPTGPKTWALYAFRSQRGESSPATGTEEIPLPPGATRLLSLESGTGAITAFQGPQSPESCMRYYDRHFTERGWRALGTWQASGTAWHIRYIPTDSSPRRAVDVRVSVGSGGQASGLIVAEGT